jgi:(1->4)-alpha-D-glucan 1-alpha-D-glucosylmutase
MSSLDELALRRGISLDYEDYKGRRRIVSDDTKRALLQALGRPVPSDAAIEQALRDVEEREWSAALPAVIVVRESQRCEITLTHDEAPEDATLSWALRLESGELRDGTLPAQAAEVLARRAVADHRRLRRRFALPGSFPAGYHTLRVSGLGIADARTSLIVVPDRCYVPEALDNGARGWGLAIQLYTLRTARDWGIGDFGDLRRLVEQAAAVGADFVGLNPIHALYPARPEHCSPYGPSSRTFLNVLYIDVAAIPEFEACERARELLASADFAERIARLRRADHVDYSGVAALKLPVLRTLHADFRAQHVARETERGRAFREFVAQAGPALTLQARFDSLSANFGGSGWRAWPQAFHDPDAAAVADFARDHAADIELHEYLQWIADEQLAAAQSGARAAGMLLGLYRDLAVGVDADGADAWAAQELYRTHASIGAPPDALALQGQDWGLPALDPHVLQARAYVDFVQLLRANMRHCGALRIDHVMSLLRLWWVPKGARSDAGAYIRYPFEDLLGILALESQRNRCLVIGEDLGTVPEQLRKALPAAGVLSYRVLYFEKESASTFKAPSQYPLIAMATVTTHDLPPLVSYWEGADLALRDRLRLFPTPEIRAQCYAERSSDRKALLRALAAEQLLPYEQDPDSAAYTQMTFELAAAIHVYLARSASALMAVQAEDLLMMRDPVNLPGTSTEHPNWQRKLTHEVDALFAGTTRRALCQRLDSERGKALLS